MMRLLTVLALLAAVAPAASVDPAWIQHYTGPTHSQFNEASDSYLDTLTGSLYVVGAGELAANPGGCDLIVMKYRQDGTRAWVNGFSGSGTSGEDMAQAIAVDSAGNVYIAGMTDNTAPQYDDAAWAKYDSNGVELWHKSSGWSGDDVAFGIAIGKAGDVYICGSDSGYGVLTGYMVARIDPSDGDTLWKRNYVLDTTALTHRSPGDVHPDYFDLYDLYDNVAVAVARSPDSGIATTGHGLHYDREREWWTMKLTPSGVQSWTAVYHNPNTVYDGDDAAFDVAVANSGDVYVVGFDYYETGSGSQGCNFAIVSYSSSGSQLNWRSIDVASEHGDDYAYSVALDDSAPQNVYVTGTLTYPRPLNEQVSTMKFNSALTPRWGSAGATYGANGDDLGYSVCYRKGRVYVAGRSVDDLVVLGYTAYNASPKDTIWLYRYDDPDQMIDFGTTVCASDSDDVFVSGEATHAGPPLWTDLYSARLRYGNSDMAVTSIVAPQGSYDHYDTVIPRVTVTNYGNVIPTFTALMYIDGTYGDTVQVYDGPAPGHSAVVEFKPWPADPTGLVAVRCTLELVGDLEPSNDFLADTVQVLPIDVGCRQIVSPTGPLDSGTSAVPAARFKNFGSTTQTFPVWFRIETAGGTASGLPDGAAGNETPGFAASASLLLKVYEDSDTITLAAQESANVSFDSWLASPPGTYLMEAFTALYGDDGPADDTVSAQLVVRQGPGIESPENLSCIPRQYSLGLPRPDPFVIRTRIPFALPARSRVSLRIYDAAGALVRTMTAAELPAGFHNVGWDGTDGRGLRVRPGTYFCRLEAPDYARITKLVVSD